MTYRTENIDEHKSREFSGFPIQSDSFNLIRENEQT